MQKRKIGIAALFLLVAGTFFAETETEEASPGGFVPAELLRPRREEVLRYPVDIVIGPLGPGRASRETYEFARRVAAALLAGDIDAPILSSVNRVFLEGYMATMEVVNPRSFRIGSGQDTLDGSVSFLVRFIGRDHGLTGELFVRQEERRIAPPPQPAAEDPPGEGDEAVEIAYEGEPDEQEALPSPPPAAVPVELVWVFEDLVLESPRSREEENQESRQRFQFSTYHRLF